MQRIAINGPTGAGKSTLARWISELLDLPYVEIDGLYWGPEWTPRSEFVDDVRAFVAQDRWVIEFQYGTARPSILERADTIVWLDLPRRVTMWRVIRRTLHRRFGHLELWNRNREGPLWRVLVDREHIIGWAWSQYDEAGARIKHIREQRPTLPIVRLRTPHEVEEWLAVLSAKPRPHRRSE